MVGSRRPEGAERRKPASRPSAGKPASRPAAWKPASRPAGGKPASRPAAGKPAPRLVAEKTWRAQGFEPALTYTHSPDTGMQNVMSVWECAMASETQQLLLQTSTIVDPLTRAKLTRSMLRQLAEERSGDGSQTARQYGGANRCGPPLKGDAASPDGVASGPQRPRSAPSHGRRTPRGSSTPRQAVPWLADANACGAQPKRPRPHSAPSHGRRGTADRGVCHLSATPRASAAVSPSPACGVVGAACGNGSGRQWLPQWIAPRDWADIAASDRRCPTTAKVGRHEWLTTAKPPSYASHERPWLSYNSSSTRAGRAGVVRPFP